MCVVTRNTLHSKRDAEIRARRNIHENTRYCRTNTLYSGWLSHRIRPTNNTSVQRHVCYEGFPGVDMGLGIAIERAGLGRTSLDRGDMWRGGGLQSDHDVSPDLDVDRLYLRIGRMCIGFSA